jgi:hypothetical protein
MAVFSGFSPSIKAYNQMFVSTNPGILGLSGINIVPVQGNKVLGLDGMCKEPVDQVRTTGFTVVWNSMMSIAHL